MKIAALICAYNEHEFISAHLKQYPEWIEKILILESVLPWQGKRSDTDQKQGEILRNLTDKRIEYIKLNWRTESDQRNWGLARLYDFDTVVTLDPDEFFTLGDWNSIRTIFEKTHLGVAAFGADFYTYWKDFDHIISPADFHRATVAVRPKRDVFFDKRSMTNQELFLFQFKMHHLSWAKSDASTWDKINNYSHANDFDLKKWYNLTWKAWKPGMKGLLPYGANKDATEAIDFNLPDSIRSLFVEE